MAILFRLKSGWLEWINMQYPPSEGGRSVGYPPSQPPDQHYMGPPGMYNNTQEKYVEEVRVSTQCTFWVKLVSGIWNLSLKSHNLVVCSFCNYICCKGPTMIGATKLALWRSIFFFIENMHVILHFIWREIILRWNIPRIQWTVSYQEVPSTQRGFETI